MEPQYDVFKVLNGRAYWIQAVPTVAAARATIQKLMAHWPCEYLIFNQETGEKITVKPDAASSERHP